MRATCNNAPSARAAAGPRDDDRGRAPAVPYADPHKGVRPPWPRSLHTTDMTLDRQDVEAIARRVAELLRGGAASAQYVDASTIARRFGVTRAWVYQHKTELGAVPLGSGPKPRLRFDITRVPQLLEGDRDAPPPQRRGRSPRSRPRR